MCTVADTRSNRRAEVAAGGEVEEGGGAPGLQAAGGVAGDRKRMRGSTRACRMRSWRG